MKRISYSIVGLITLGLVASCATDENGNPIPPDIITPLIKACGLGCPGDTDAEGAKIKGVLEGNASISGVAKVDAFFAAVNNFRSAADNASAGIEAQLAAIRGDFGIAADADLKAGIEAQIRTNVEGSVSVAYQPVSCAVDAQATLKAQAQCEAKVDPGMVSVKCEGACQIEAGAELKCDAGADLQCTFNGPTVDCKGECTGTCEAKLDIAAACSGTCRGTCMGNCSAYSDSGATQCAGSCDGMCKGTCEAKAEAGVKCSGTCKGECKVSGPDVDCKGSAHAECKAKADATVECKGKCEGDFEPPSASAECKATAKAEAKLNVECSPPRLAINYKLKAGVDAMAKAKFEIALKTLVQVRMPALLAAIGRANSISSAGEDLALAAEGAVKASVKTATDGKLGIRATFGLGCALKELPRVEMATADSADRLVDSVNDSMAVAGLMGVK